MLSTILQQLAAPQQLIGRFATGVVLVVLLRFAADLVVVALRDKHPVAAQRLHRIVTPRYSLGRICDYVAMSPICRIAIGLVFAASVALGVALAFIK